MFVFNQVVVSIISVNLSKFLWKLMKDQFDSDVFRDLRMYKLIVLVLLLVMVLLILEPEKLKVSFFWVDIYGWCLLGGFIELGFGYLHVIGIFTINTC